MSEPKSPESLRQYLSRDLLGEIPLFFEQVMVKDKKASSDDAPIMHQRTIAVDAYQTEQYESRAYHKAISKIV